SFVLWDSQVPKRIVQLLNKIGWSVSHTSQGRCISQLSQDAVRVARDVACDESKLKLLPYDNFNWTARAWEVSATHGAAQHDQVSAMLVVLNRPDTSESSPGAASAQHLASVERFESTAGHRHRLSPEDALQAVIPDHNDHQSFRTRASIHISHILTEEIEFLSSLRSAIPKFYDPEAIPPHKTECYYLPTFDQEQGSTRGNMVVLEHYFLKVLNIPKPVFERIMYFVLGDRLTTARDRAAQDQRAVDRSDFRFDHLSSFAMTSGLMHVCLNFIINLGKNLWGEGSKDPTALHILRDLLPNRSEINLRKTDFYAWLRFLDVILRALTITATMSILKINDVTAFLSRPKPTEDQFHGLCYKVVDQCLLPSLDRLEAVGVKVIPGETQSGHAVLIMHDLMTLREMRHAIKHGHPSRILCMLKYWTPMFYAGLSYNYANECMELLHNVQHDWPLDSAKILWAGMLVNNTGREDGFVEADLNVEHLNKRIQGRTRGPNVSTHTLEKAAPAMGHIRHLTDQIFHDMGVEDQYQSHSHVSQHKDVLILVKHLVQSEVFDFDSDKATTRKVVDLYRTGVQRLAGTKGGHARHLIRHRLRLRKRHDRASDTFRGPEPQPSDIEEASQELMDAFDSRPPNYTTGEVTDLLHVLDTIDEEQGSTSDGEI
ncbi:hypothetical protein PAXINDRAFT_92403, partial [Paxillus involutus ATCC 200175]